MKIEPTPLVVFALHTGCIHEGGGLVDIYRSKESATKNVLLLIEQQDKESYELWKDDDMPEMIRTFKQESDTYWSNGMDYISIQEVTVKD